jgi:osmotically-inducible protein OsmY
MSVFGWTWRVSAVALALSWQTQTVAVAQTAAAGGGATQQQVSRDQAITAQIVDRFHQDASFRHADIKVTSNDGVVTLAGAVPSNVAREQAVTVARSTPGVTQVEDLLRLPASSPEAPEPRN